MGFQASAHLFVQTTFRLVVKTLLDQPQGHLQPPHKRMELLKLLELPVRLVGLLELLTSTEPPQLLEQVELLDPPEQLVLMELLELLEQVELLEVLELLVALELLEPQDLDAFQAQRDVSVHKIPHVSPH